jgi:hypothetical protein
VVHTNLHVDVDDDLMLGSSAMAKDNTVLAVIVRRVSQGMPKNSMALYRKCNPPGKEVLAEVSAQAK